MTKVRHTDRMKVASLGEVQTVDEPLGKWTALKALGPVMYALRLDGGVIKIGFTTNLADRECTVRRQGKSQTSEVLAFRPSTIDEEQAIHAQLVGHRAHGREYYHPTPTVLAVVNDMRTTLGLDPVT